MFLKAYFRMNAGLNYRKYTIRLSATNTRKEAKHDDL